jgi:uncharacterized membrane protein (DUF2068 family)
MNSLQPPGLEQRALRVIAGFEALKGVAALTSAMGLLELMHHDLHHLASELIGHFGLNPHQHYPALLLQWVDELNNTPVRTVLLLAGAYASIRLLEAYGLWRVRAWGEGLGAASGLLYVPFEVRHLLHDPGWISLGVLLFNLLLVAFLLWQLKRRRQR